MARAWSWLVAGSSHTRLAFDSRGLLSACLGMYRVVSSLDSRLASADRRRFVAAAQEGCIGDDWWVVSRGPSELVCHRETGMLRTVPGGRGIMVSFAVFLVVLLS